MTVAEVGDSHLPPCYPISRISAIGKSSILATHHLDRNRNAIATCLASRLDSDSGLSPMPPLGVVSVEHSCQRPVLQVAARVLL